MKKRALFFVFPTLLVCALLVPGLGFAQKTAKVTFYWALYDGLTEEFRADL